MNKDQWSRRDFLRNLAAGAGGIIVFGSMGVYFVPSGKDLKIRAIVVNFDRCAGCRTCETACSAFNHPVKMNGEKMNGAGNPHLSNIKVHHFNPDVDIPVTCAICHEPPCVDACPVSPHPETGHKALYRDEELHVILHDAERCIACERCANACREERSGVLYPDKDTGMPQRMCTLCGGDPQCVKHCPYEALSWIEVDDTGEFRGQSPSAIAEALIERYYGPIVN